MSMSDETKDRCTTEYHDPNNHTVSQCQLIHGHNSLHSALNGKLIWAVSTETKDAMDARRGPVNIHSCDTEQKLRRRYELLQAAATILHRGDTNCFSAVLDAEKLLEHIESRETT
jgi:hypothetical protein